MKNGNIKEEDVEEVPWRAWWHESNRRQIEKLLSAVLSQPMQKMKKKKLACQLAKPLKRSLAKNSFPGKSACRFPLQLLNQVGYFYICQVNSFENTTNGQWLLGN
ncbi:hypothetical protein T08_253 [Trichinella sp. T8]|nr:hypothetical protein T08_253 [Trichinella sp. T8]